jgi:dipeptidyl aminopeptidase/acylaminoacyl peptidase
LKDLKKKKETALTAFANPYPMMEGVTKEKIKYKRADGIDLTATVYLPAGYDKEKDGRLPVLMWAYPREYRNAKDAAQVRGSQYNFSIIKYGSPIFWVTQGYCVMENVEMPIVGTEDKEPNDTYIEQLVMDAEAAVKVITEMGVGDPDRIGVGGHSYGAFMTGNLLTHTKLFKAGIARSGAYNRTLTPFGFQAETRTFWESPEVYNAMSPFNYANQLSGALLLVHGELDNNTGTFPIQSERFYQALKGHKATVRYVVLPLESHSYSAKENILHLLYEENAWLEKFVKNAGK